MKKTMKKLLPLLLAVVMSLAFAGAALAQDVTANPADSDNATITITNAAKGETYTVVKLFDATVTGTDGGSIAYQGEIPSDLTTYFTKDTTTGEITATDAAKDGDKLSANAQAALKTWAEGKTATATAASDGSTLNFKGLPYGYYVVLTTQGTNAITVTSTNPSASIVDKNTTEPVIQKKVKNANEEWVEVTAAEIGTPQEFKVDVTTANWYTPAGATDQKQIKEYVIGEDFDTNKFDLVSIDSVQVIKHDATQNKDEVLATLAVNDVATMSDGAASFPITVPWVGTDDQANTNLYSNGAIIRVIYKAKLADDALVDVGNTNEDLRGNVNTADLNWKYNDQGSTPHFGEGEDHLTDTASVDTYALGLKKFNKSGEALAGAEFTFPFYVKADADGVAQANTDGNYVYAGTTNGAGLTNKIVTPTNGQITVVGVKNTAYQVRETKAPDGYNKLAAAISVTPTKISSTTTVTKTDKTWKIDENGNVTDLQEDETATTTTTYTNNTVAATVVSALNLTGTTLPSTGGIGTTIFYVAGSALVLVAGAALFARRVARKQS